MSHCISHWHRLSLKHLFRVEEKGPFEVVGGGKYDRRAACSEELNGGLPTISVKVRTLRTFCSRTCSSHFLSNQGSYDCSDTPTSEPEMLFPQYGVDYTWGAAGSLRSSILLHLR